MNWIHFGLFFVGLTLVLAGVVSVLGAVEYEIAHEETADDPMGLSEAIGDHGTTPYGDLSAEERRIVDGTIDGERYRLGTGDSVAVAWGNARVVETDDQYHYITRRSVVDWGSTAGIAAVVLAVSGLGLVAESIRRHHFPNYRPFGTR